MTDIVERLRVHAWRSDGWTRQDSAEAADEIERLRDAVRTFLEADDHWLRGNKGGEWAAMMAVARAKARAALKETGHE
jgi:hypothetical protein